MRVSSCSPQALAMTSTQTHSKGPKDTTVGSARGPLNASSGTMPPNTASTTVSTIEQASEEAGEQASEEANGKTSVKTNGKTGGRTSGKTRNEPVNRQGTFTGANSLKLFYQSWYPAASETTYHTAAVRGVLVLVHGLGEHSGRYCSVIQALTAAGYAVFAFDNQGHGKSEGQRGHIDSWQNYRDNTAAFLQLVRQQEPTAPLFLMGHSLGGLIVLDWVLQKAHAADFQALNILGLVVSAPPISPSEGTASQVRIMLARLLSGLFPRLSLKMGLAECGLSRDQNIADQLAQDPLIHPYVTLRWGTETLNTIDWVKSHIHQLQMPILLTHGEADPIIDVAGSREIFQQIGTDRKTLKIYPGSYHEPHNDLDSRLVVRDLIHWMSTQMSAQEEDLAQ